jgi:hypothetical protein
VRVSEKLAYIQAASLWTGGFFSCIHAILFGALARYDTGIQHIAISKHDGIIAIIRLHQGGRT